MSVSSSMTALSVSFCTAFMRLSIAVVASFNAADVLGFIVLLPFRVLGVKLCISLYCTTKVLHFSHICNIMGIYFAMFLDFLITFNYVVSGSLGLRFGAFAAVVPHMPRSVARAFLVCAAGAFCAFSALSLLINVKSVLFFVTIDFNTCVKFCLSSFVKIPFTFRSCLTFRIFSLSAALLRVPRLILTFAAERQRERLFPADKAASRSLSSPASPQFPIIGMGAGTVYY